MSPEVQSYKDKITSEFEKCFEPTLRVVPKETINSFVSAQGVEIETDVKELLSFSMQPPKGVGEYEHRQSFRYTLARAEAVLDRNGSPINLIIGGYQGVALVSTCAPGFKGASLSRLEYAKKFGNANLCFCGRYDETIPVLRSAWVPDNQIICLSVPSFCGENKNLDANDILQEALKSGNFVKIVLQKQKPVYDTNDILSQTLGFATFWFLGVGMSQQLVQILQYDPIVLMFSSFAFAILLSGIKLFLIDRGGTK